VSKDEPQPISITLSPTQVESVLRMAAEGRAPSLSALVLMRVGSRRSDDRSGKAPLGFSLTDTSDSRLSRSLLRGLSLLTCFGDDGEPRGIVDMAQELDMSPSTAHRYALTLLHLGLLERSPQTRKYSLPKLDLAAAGLDG
jgi:hypothetical protein